MGLQCHQSPCFSWGSHSTTSTCSVPAGHACVALLVFAHPGHKSIRDCTPGSEECSKCFPGTWLQECTTPAPALLQILPPDLHHPASVLHPPERRLRCAAGVVPVLVGPLLREALTFPAEQLWAEQSRHAVPAPILEINGDLLSFQSLQMGSADKPAISERSLC